MSDEFVEQVAFELVTALACRWDRLSDSNREHWRNEARWILALPSIQTALAGSEQAVSS